MRQSSAYERFLMLMTGAVMLHILVNWCVSYNIGSYLGMMKEPPTTLKRDKNAIVNEHRACEDRLSVGVAHSYHQSSADIAPALLFTKAVKCNECAAERSQSGNTTFLSRQWYIINDQKCLNESHLDSNVCLSMPKRMVTDLNILYNPSMKSVVRCLPSFIIAGFEKCSTTEILIWLSYHPNLLSHWSETRFFQDYNKRIKRGVKLTSKETFHIHEMWRRYLDTLPMIPRGTKGIGKYFTFQKSPSYITSAQMGKDIATIMPSLRVLLMIRNPTDRAYSSFVMYTNILAVPGIGRKQSAPKVNSSSSSSSSSSSGGGSGSGTGQGKIPRQMTLLKSRSSIIKNYITGEVRFEIYGGEGGACVPREYGEYYPGKTHQKFLLQRSSNHHYHKSNSNSNRNRSGTIQQRHQQQGGEEETQDEEEEKGGEAACEGTDWKYVAFPPAAEDFHRYIQWALSPATNNFFPSSFSNSTRTSNNATAATTNNMRATWSWTSPFAPTSTMPTTYAGALTREQRILYNGFYAFAMRQWLTHFPSRHFLVIPTETLWRGNLPENLASLQRLLGLPVYDYGKISHLDPATGRYKLHSIAVDMLRISTFHSSGRVPPMLDKTRALLDELYCQPNQELQKLLGESQPLPEDYVCASAKAANAS